MGVIKGDLGYQTIARMSSIFFGDIIVPNIE